MKMNYNYAIIMIINSSSGSNSYNNTVTNVLLSFFLLFIYIAHLYTT